RIGFQAHVLIAGETGLAFAATEPRVDQRDVADLEATGGRLGIRPKRHHFANGLMSHGSRQRHAAVPERKRLASMAEIIAAFPDVQIAVAHAGRLDLDQDLRSRRLRGRHVHLFQGRIEIGDLETLHRYSPIGAAFANKMRTFYWSALALDSTLPRISPRRRDQAGPELPTGYAVPPS